MASLTIPELFEAAVAEVPDRVWLLYEDEAFTYAEARERIGRAATALAGLGVRPGSLVLAAARNRPDYVFLWLAVAYLGGIHVAVDPRSADAELAGLFAQVDPSVVVADRDFPGAGRTIPVEELLAAPSTAATPDGAGPTPRHPTLSD